MGSQSHRLPMLKCPTLPVAPHCRTKTQGAGLDPNLGVEIVGLGVETGRFR